MKTAPRATRTDILILWVFAGIAGWIVVYLIYLVLDGLANQAARFI